MSTRQTSSLVTLAMAIAISATGQPNVFVSFRNYSQQEGLSSYNITKIVQDRYGFLWIGTQDGVNCFDGRHFSTLGKDSDPQHQLPGNNITDMVEDSARGLIWVAASQGGIAAIDEQTRTIRYTITGNPADVHFKDSWIHSLCLCGNTMWIGTYGGLFIYNITTRRFFSPPGGAQVDSPDVARIICDDFDHVWAFCNGRGVLVFSGHSGRLLSTITQGSLDFDKAPDSIRWWNVLQDGKHGVYAATNWGLRKLQYDSTHFTVVPPGRDVPFFHEPLFGCTLDRKGRIWFSNSARLLRWDPAGDKLENIADIEQGSTSWQSTIYSLFTDRQGDIWAGSEEGLSFLPQAPQPFDKFCHSSSSNIRIQHAFTLHPAGDSIMYCGATNGLYKVNLDNRGITRIDEADSYYMMEEVDARHLLLSSSRGLLVVSGGHISPATTAYPFLQPIAHELFCASVRFNDSLLVFGSQLQKGLFVCNTRSKTVRSYNSRNSTLHPDNDVINGLFKDSQGSLWILSVNTLFRFDPITGIAVRYPVRHPVTREKCGFFFDMCETTNNFWFAAYGQGLIETDKQMHVKKLFSTSDGLANNGVYRVFPYHDSLILVTSNNGLSVLSIADGRLRSYYSKDGLQSDAFEQFCGAGHGAFIFAGGIDGFTRIDPAFLPSHDSLPHLYISRVKIDLPSMTRDTTDLLLSQLTVPQDALQTTVYFSLPNYTLHGNSAVEYRIPEINETWSRLTGQDFISLIGLAPKTYHLEVRAIGHDGIPTTPARIKLIFLPKWYQTLWFMILVVAVVAGLFYALYRYRISQIRQRQLIRQGISSDLHDDIGSTLNTIRIFTHLAKKGAGMEHYLDKIETSLSQAVVALRDIIWVLDDSQDTIFELMERIRQFAVPVTTAHGVHFEIAAAESITGQSLLKAEKRNLLLIAKESINNSLKYARCTRIDIRIGLDGKSLTMEIEDDGQGFDAGKVQPGYGLKNILHRATQIRFIAKIDSAPGKGTRIILQKAGNKANRLPA